MNQNHKIPKLSFPSNIAVSNFVYSIYFVGYSGISNVLKLKITKTIPCVSDWKVSYIKGFLKRYRKVGIKYGQFRRACQKLNEFIQLLLVKSFQNFPYPLDKYRCFSVSFSIINMSLKNIN